MKIIIAVYVILTAITTSFSQPLCIVDCEAGCRKSLEKKISELEVKYRQCSSKCYTTYGPAYTIGTFPDSNDLSGVYSGNDYYFDFCEEQCNVDYQEAVEAALASFDFCKDLCEIQYEDNLECECECPDGFSYNSTTGDCEYEMPEGFRAFEVGESIVIRRRSISSSSFDCPPFWSTNPVIEGCEYRTMTEECVDIISEAENEAALDIAMGNPVDLNALQDWINSMENDPDCYVTVPCNYCDHPQSSEFEFELTENGDITTKYRCD